MWKFDDEPRNMRACILIAPDGAEVPAMYHGLSVKAGELLCSFEGVASGDGGTGKRGFMSIPLADFDPADAAIMRNQLRSAVQSFRNGT